MKRIFMALFALGLLLAPMQATAQDKLVVSVWGGSWRDMVANIIAKKFTAETGVQVEFITGGTIDRLNKAKLAKGNPESDITFTTSHVGWLYANDGLYETLDLGKVPNAKNLVAQAKISPYHIGTWAYVYTIGYRPDLVPAGITFDSWADLWKPELKGKLAAPDFDPSHLIVVAAHARRAATPPPGKRVRRSSRRSSRTSRPSTPTTRHRQQLHAERRDAGAGDAVDERLLHRQPGRADRSSSIPKEGAVLGIDTVGIMKGSQEGGARLQVHQHRCSIRRCRPKIAKLKKGSPVVLDAKLDPAVAKLPGVFTTADQWNKQAIVIDHKLRAEKTARVAQVVRRERHELTA